MPDIVNTATRSRMMSGIRSKNTKPEIKIRKGLFARGFRYRLHANEIPGKPDLVFPKHHAVIFVHGCFWHGHDCHLFKLPGTRKEFWSAKIARNQERDREVSILLKSDGWRQLNIWECAIRGRGRKGIESVVDEAEKWLLSGSKIKEIRGDPRWH